MDLLNGKDLIDKKGNTVSVKTVLRGKKYVVLYFSASTCTAHHNLLQRMRIIHEEAIKRNIPLEIIYVSLDASKREMLEFFKAHHGKWYAIPFGDSVIEELRLTFGVTSIPHIIVVKIDGTVISINGKKEIEDIGINVLVTWTD